jgi:hypothetical protein
MRKVWQPQEVNYLKENYATKSMHVMCTHLQVTNEAIQKKAQKLGLKRGKEDLYNSGIMYGINGNIINFNKSTGIRGEVLKLKPFNPNGKKLVKIDNRTWVYMNPGQTVEDMRVKYSRPSLAATF